MPTTAARGRRPTLSRDAVLRGALALADAEGIDALTMRRLGETLGVGPMAMYRHVANKEEIVDGIVDLVFAEVGLPRADGDWRAAMRERALALNGALVRHPWAVGLMDSRANPGPHTLAHHDAVLGCLRAGGFDPRMAGHAYAVLDSYIYGFASTQVSLPFASPDEVSDVARQMLDPFPAGSYPHLVEFVSEVVMRPGYDFRDEFAWGLDLVLDGVGRALRAGGRGARRAGR